jgi:hypothetical protein
MIPLAYAAVLVGALAGFAAAVFLPWPWSLLLAVPSVALYWAVVWVLGTRHRRSA